MPRKPSPKPDDPAEYKRFLETARKLGADESPEAMERAFKKVIKRAPVKNAPTGLHPVRLTAS